MHPSTPCPCSKSLKTPAHCNEPLTAPGHAPLKPVQCTSRPIHCNAHLTTPCQGPCPCTPAIPPQAVHPSIAPAHALHPVNPAHCNAGTVPLPTCIMEAQVGADLRSAMGGRDRGIIDVSHLGSLSVTTAPLATSKNFTMLQIAGGLIGCSYSQQTCRRSAMPLCRVPG